MRRNVDFVRYTPQWDISWSFIVAGKSTHISEILDEALGMAKKIMDISGDLFIPTKIGYSLQIYQEDMPANKIFEPFVSPIGITRRELESDKGVSFRELWDDVRTVVRLEQYAEKKPEAGIRYIGGIDFPEGKTLFTLEGRDVFINKHSRGLSADVDEDVIEAEQVINNEQRSDLLFFNINQSVIKGANRRVDISDPAYYIIDFWTHTDIWFVKTEIGFANRYRLRRVLKNVCNSFDVVYTSSSSELSRNLLFEVNSRS